MFDDSFCIVAMLLRLLLLLLLLWRARATRESNREIEERRVK
jgi:hypothetical protein